MGGNAAGVLGAGGAGGAGINNYGTITSLTNSGAITGVAGGSGNHPGVAGEGLLNETSGIIGVLDNQANGTIDVIDNKGAIGGGVASKTGPRKRRQDRHADQ